VQRASQDASITLCVQLGCIVFQFLVRWHAQHGVKISIVFADLGYIGINQVRTSESPTAEQKLKLLDVCGEDIQGMNSGHVGTRTNIHLKTPVHVDCKAGKYGD
jgi:hypothetical protein